MKKFTILALFAIIGTSVAAHQFSGLTTTAGGYSTYDADHVNAEGPAPTRRSFPPAPVAGWASGTILRSRVQTSIASGG